MKIQDITGQSNVLVAFLDRPVTVGHAAIVSESTANRLTSMSVKKLFLELHSQGRIIRNIPTVSEEATAGLDEEGFAPVGAKVKKDDILIAAVSPKRPDEMTAEDQLLRSIFSEEVANIKDASLRMPYLDEAIVVGVDKENAALEILIKRSVRIGDILEDGSANRFVVAEIAPDDQMPFCRSLNERVEMIANSTVYNEMDLKLDFKLHSLGRKKVRVGKLQLKKLSLLAEDKMSGRSTGLYSLITHTPLADESGWRKGAKITEQDLRCLQNSGCYRIMHELLSGDFQNAAFTYEAIVTRKEIPEPKMPEICKVLIQMLQGLGIKVELSDTELKLSFATTEDVWQWSYGIVDTEKLINDRTMKPFSGGLLSEKIFGPLQDYHCSCGKYSRIRYKGIICDKCGVEVTKAKVRRERMGHIQLATSVSHPLCPEIMLEAIPVIPPDLRPMIPHNEGYAMADLNWKYQYIVQRNNTLERLQSLNAPDNVLANEKRLLEKSVSRLFMELLGYHAFSGGEPFVGSADYVYRCFWWNRTADFSGQAILVPDNALDVNDCGLPKEMALEMFKPLVMRRLIEKGFSHNARSARKRAESKSTEVWQALKEAMQNYFVIACYRSDNVSQMQAFRPILTDGEVIRLNAAVCGHMGIKATLDGETIDVYLPISQNGQAEAKELFLQPVAKLSSQLPPVSSVLLFENQGLQDFLAGLRDELRRTGQTEKTMPLSKLDKSLLFAGSFFSHLAETPMDSSLDIPDLEKI